MPAQVLSSVENNFTKGFVTEYTGMNFPENAATFTTNCIYDITGDVVRRLGINNELNGTTLAVDRTLMAMSTYVWNNPGGDGNSKLMVKQVGSKLYFYNIATSTVASPLSTQLLVGTVSLSPVSNGTVDTTKECTYADGSGYLFVYHSSCDTAYVTYNSGTLALALNTIPLQIRDFVGAYENVPVNQRPSTLNTEHTYNLQNQGWTSANPWNGIDTTTRANPMALGSYTYTIGTGLTVPNGQLVSFYLEDTRGNGTNVGTGVGSVTGYTSGSGVLVLNVFSYINIVPGFLTGNITKLTPISTGYISTWFSAEGNYPSNADVWWYFKNSSDAFDPATTAPNVDLATGQAPQGHYILPAFTLDRTVISGVAGITPVTTMKRPTNGCWFQGRVFYTGVSDTFPAQGDVNSYSWTENVYFSNTVTTPSDFGNCFQTNDPTSENLFGLLPTDGGVFPVVGSGTIHKLFSISNGLLIFANNGVWFATGSQGIGFTANDFTLTKISSIKILSHDSFIDVNGLPMFWNEEGIYQVTPSQNGIQMSVDPITVSTILTYYADIPLASKKYARGSYNPIDYVVQWCFRSTQETSVTDRYQFDTILVYNVYTKAFYIYNISAGSNTNYIHGIDYISYPYVSTVAPDPDFKYHCSALITGTYQHSFAEEYDDSYLDWGGADYTSEFITGYKLHGQGQKWFQIPYIYVFSRPNGVENAYTIQGIWDYAISSSSGKWSTSQLVEIYNPNFGVVFRRHRIRGRGLVLQIKISSVSGLPFDIIGWSVSEVVNQGV